MLIVFVRTFIIYAVVVVLMRLMGKRQIGQLEPYELVVAVMIAELAAIPMEDKAIPLVHGLIPIFTLFFIQVCISYINMKSLWFRSFMDGSPSIVIRNAKSILMSHKARYNINELLSSSVPRVRQYRRCGVCNPETSGNLSVIPSRKGRLPQRICISIPDLKACLCPWFLTGRSSATTFRMLV